MIIFVREKNERYFPCLLTLIFNTYIAYGILLRLLIMEFLFSLHVPELSLKHTEQIIF